MHAVSALADAHTSVLLAGLTSWDSSRGGSRRSRSRESGAEEGESSKEGESHDVWMLETKGKE